MLLQRQQTHLGKLLQEPGNGSLVLLRGKGAGGIEKLAPGSQHSGGPGQNLPLHSRALPGFSRRPGPDDRRVFPEHSFAGAGSVHQDFVEKLREALRQPGRGLVGHKQVGDPEELQISQQSFGSGVADVVGHQHPLSLKLGPQLCGLSPGSRAEIQHPLSRLHGKESRRSHGAGLLEIIESGGIEGMAGRRIRPVIEIAVIHPGNRSHRKGRQPLQLPGRQLQPVGPQAVAPLLAEALQVGLILLSQHLPHSLFKFHRQSVHTLPLTPGAPGRLFFPGGRRLFLITRKTSSPRNFSGEMKEGTAWPPPNLYLS